MGIVLYWLVTGILLWLVTRTKGSILTEKIFNELGVCLIMGGIMFPLLVIVYIISIIHGALRGSYEEKK